MPLLGLSNSKGSPKSMGNMKFSNGMYHGEWRDNRMCGWGTFTFNSGSYYTGHFKDDMFNGNGTYCWMDGKKYVGEYVDGKRDGNGVQEYRNGNVYKGTWKQDKKDGRGAMLYSTGDLYIGKWKENKKEGKGVLWASTGEKVEQLWAKGKLVEEYSLDEEECTEVVKLKKSKSKGNVGKKQDIETAKCNREICLLQLENSKLSEQLDAQNRKVQELEARLDEELSANLCVICFENSRDTVVLPCMHFLFCMHCTLALTNNKCPTCRCTIQGKLQCVIKP